MNKQKFRSAIKILEFRRLSQPFVDFPGVSFLLCSSGDQRLPTASSGAQGRAKDLAGSPPGAEPAAPRRGKPLVFLEWQSSFVNEWDVSY